MGVNALLGNKAQELSKNESSAIDAKTFVYFWACKLFNLSFERFISSRLIRQKHLGLRVSRPVLRISVVSIALAILVNSLTLAIVRGFQQKIKDKITGFNAPLFISKAGSAHIFEAEALDRRISFLPELEQIPGVSTISPVAFKPLLLQSPRFNDTIQTAAPQEDRTIALITHLSGIIAGFIVPLIIWLINKDKPEKSWLTDQSKEALNVQITLLLAYIVCMVLTIVFIGALLMPLVWIASLIFMILAGVAANKGENYRYPVALRLIS